ncbi:efflux RND transporter permease subunit [Pajaroellobacter abortibovis]|uniref:Uncharacterized protein n=1 Tax=Pajaroellobacter abortibovis TaxID=1882918 RepID=A0A1L6MV36_9BACT|nr:efflux RND transporter permease subunit [Pajaroellobacter abortibovis]APR99341.1 hypothetical protein BCY86_00600 [Pajaroellobacter abortibovis]
MITRGSCFHSASPLFTLSPPFNSRVFSIIHDHVDLPSRAFRSDHRPFHHEQYPGTLIGIVLLMGLVTKNTIFLIDRAIVHVREHGEPPPQAIIEAGHERLRPIIITSAAMILGMLPTAIGKGDGSEFRAPIGIASHQRSDQLNNFFTYRKFLFLFNF